MAAVLENPVAMSSSYLHLLTGGTLQCSEGAWDLDEFEQQQLGALLEEASSNHVPGVEVSDYMCFDDDEDDSPLRPAVIAADEDVARVDQEAPTGDYDLDASSWSVAATADGAGKLGCSVRAGDGVGSGSKRKKEGGAATAAACTRKRIGFRTKSEVDVLDDGYKWRKYGKKSVKNSPNPRNYYKCSCQGCNVKKRVERDSQDSSYVLTIYEGVHNHVSPSSNGGRYTINSSFCGDLAASSWHSAGGGSWPGFSSGGWDTSTVQFSFC